MGFFNFRNKRKNKRSAVEVLPRSEAAQKAIDDAAKTKRQKHEIKQRYNFNDVVKKIERFYKEQRTQEEKDIDDWVEYELFKHQQYIDKIKKGESAAKKLNSSKKTLVNSKNSSKTTLVNSKSSSKKSSSNKSKTTSKKSSNHAKQLVRI